MKIGFFGNTNNYPFSLATALRELGHEVCFLVADKTPLYRPESRFPDALAGYGDWIHDVSPVRTSDLLLPTPKNLLIRRKLSDCDALVFNSLGPCLSVYFPVPTLVILTGSDLDLYADPEAIEKFCAVERGWKNRFFGFAKRWLYGRLLLRQRFGIRMAAAVEYSFPGMLPHGDELLNEIGVQESRRRCYLITDIKRLQYKPLANNRVIRLFSATRLNWVLPLPEGFSIMDYKGTDVMLRGIAKFLQATGMDLEVRLVKKGLHVQETIRLAEDIGLAKFITWLDEMSQDEVLREFELADIVLDHFGDGSIGVAGRDSMALGRPVIGNGKPEIFERWLGVPMPVVQARTEEQLCARLLELTKDPSARERYGRLGRDFAERFFDARRAANDALSAFAAAGSRSA